MPSACDLGTDYSFAETLKDDSLRCVSYLFISLPVTVYYGYLLTKALKCCFNRGGPTRLGYTIEILITMVSWVVTVSGVVIVLLNCMWTTATTAATTALVMKIIATLVGSALLGVKVLAVFVHTENMKMISVKATNYEGLYESSLQLVLVLYVKLSGREVVPTKLIILTMLTSLVMIGKSGAENFLTFKENKLAGKNIFSKFKMLAKLSPPFLLTAIFRISTISLCFARNELTYYLFLPVAFVLPFIFLAMLKLCGFLQDFLVADLARGTAGELTSIVLWGNTGREGSRKIQLWIGGYILVLYSAFLLLVTSPKGSLPVGFGLDGCKEMARTMPASPELCFGVFLSGCVGYTLFICQLFQFDK